MTSKVLASQHHIFGILPDRTINAYHFNADKHQSPNNIWQFKKNFKYFSIYLELLLRKRNTQKKFHTAEAKLIAATFDAIENKGEYKQLDLSQTSLGLMRLGTGQDLIALQRHIDIFEPVLTPQYHKFLPKMVFSLPVRDELLFHSCNPDIYLWIPPQSKTPKKVIVVYLTKSNTLNMPRHIAHFILAKLGVAVMYINNRPNITPDEALMGHSLEESSRIILSITKKYGFEELYGVGVSYGGFMLCQLAQSLHLKRILNFSGVKERGPGQANDEAGYMKISSDYPKSNILSILSSVDVLDREILKSYDAEGFLTERAFLASNTHGSFTAAFIEGKLDEFFAWLLE
jgi:hypothetical protein